LCMHPLQRYLALPSVHLATQRGTLGGSTCLHTNALARGSWYWESVDFCTLKPSRYQGDVETGDHPGRIEQLISSQLTADSKRGYLKNPAVSADVTQISRRDLVHQAPQLEVADTGSTCQVPSDLRSILAHFHAGLDRNIGLRCGVWFLLGYRNRQHALGNSESLCITHTMLFGTR
jgi:hypothetical protein